MSWQYGRRYYYRSVRIGGRVVSKYVGGGALAQLVFAMDQERIQERRQTRQAIAEANREHRGARLAEHGRAEWIKRLVATALEGLGFVRYNRGPWKRTSTMNALDGNSRADDSILAEIRSLVRENQRGCENAIERLAVLSRSHPAAFAKEVSIDLWRIACTLLASNECPSDAKRRSDMQAGIELAAFALAGENPSPARILCARAAAFAWAELMILSAKSAAEGLGNQSVEATRRRTAAQRRALSAIKTLEQIAALENVTKRKAGESTIFAQLGVGLTA